MKISSVNNTNFKAKLQFISTVNTSRSAVQNCCRESVKDLTKTAMCVKRSFVFLALFPAILAKLHKVKDSVKIPT